MRVEVQRVSDKSRRWKEGQSGAWLGAAGRTTYGTTDEGEFWLSHRFRSNDSDLDLKVILYFENENSATRWHVQFKSEEALHAALTTMAMAQDHTDRERMALVRIHKPVTFVCENENRQIGTEDWAELTTGMIKGRVKELSSLGWRVREVQVGETQNPLDYEVWGGDI